jgi:hypothetical protein
MVIQFVFIVVLSGLYLRLVQAYDLRCNAPCIFLHLFKFVQFANSFPLILVLNCLCDAQSANGSSRFLLKPALLFLPRPGIG